MKERVKTAKDYHDEQIDKYSCDRCNGHVYTDTYKPIERICDSSSDWMICDKCHGEIIQRLESSSQNRPTPPSE